MHTVIVLLRGINVGGRNKLLMASLTEALESLNLEDVRTYIQSGNVVARSRRKPASNLGSRIAAAIESSHGFSPAVLVLTTAELENAISGNPFPEAADEPKTLHLFFLAKPAKQADLAAIETACGMNEKFELTERVFYLHAPEGIGRSKLAANAEKLLGVGVTARNWRTVGKLQEMVKIE